ncbi:peptidase domain-containing ABC transporter [Archangium violaceum]|uniref:peptidase domain-containing ABC transporter n=1 Tax=Archangium violaceum TaxID=83451 RepID=UPI001951AD23|nr:peptidase domain-containing ABC transporter [Archangium violaceum]QRN97724.1 peptidase domain-containing ABC transporter [Archangium violaceum]
MSEENPRGFFDRFPALLQLGRSGRKRRIPLVRQLAATECGAACLSMVLAYHGRRVSLDELRGTMGVGRDGTTALDVLRAGRAYGLHGRGVKVELNEVELLEPGAILHWEFKHFVVFEAVRDGGVDLLDPGLGRRHIPLESFARSFTGVAVLFEPGEGFEKGGTRTSPAGRYVRQVVQQWPLLARVALVSAALQFFALAVPSLTGAVVDSIIPRGDSRLLMVVGAGLVSLTVFQFLVTLVRAHLLLHLRTWLDARMTLRFLDYMVDLPLSFFQLRSAGDLMGRVNSHSTIREMLTTGALSGLLDGVMVCGYLVLLMVLSPALGLLSLGLAVVQVLVFVVPMAKQRELLARNLEAEATSQSYLLEMLTGMPTLKALGVEPRSVEHWSNLYVDVLNSSLDRGRLNALTESAGNALRLASPLVILCVGASLVLQGQLSLGTMLALSALAAGFLTSLATLVGTANQLQLLGGYMERLGDILDSPPEQPRGEPRPPHTLRGGIKLEQVSFRYSAQGALVVKDVTVDIPPGQFVAIVGRSGAGKTTLAQLLVGMYLPSSGRVLYDGVDLASLDLRAVRRQLGIVMQNPALFRGSIRSNIALADPSLTLEEVERAAQLAQVHQDIMGMPMGYETLLSDMGGAISGGQRQRLALARALAMKPAVLLLDEATNALDTVTERRVQDALAELRCTRVVIAHRLSTVQAADLILVMDAGQVVESGTHEELMRRGGFYATLVHAPGSELKHDKAG